VKTKEFVVRSAETAAKAICEELLDESKATYKYTSMSLNQITPTNIAQRRGKELCWGREQLMTKPKVH
jgi:hypothetical protein